MENKDTYKCSCGEIFSVIQISTLFPHHIKYCKPFLEKHKAVYQAIKHIAGTFPINFEPLILSAICSNITESNRLVLTPTPKDDNEYNFSDSEEQEEQDDDEDLYTNMVDQHFKFPCEACTKYMDPSNVVQLNCGHIICKQCVSSRMLYRTYNHSSLVCAICKSNVDLDFLKRVMGEQYKSIIEELDDFLVQQAAGGGIRISCSNCGKVYLFEPGNIMDAPKQHNGEPLSLEQRDHFSKYRFRCPSCTEDQCRSCKVIPYHIGMDCDQFKNLVPCRYCEDPLEHKVDYSITPFSDICALNQECLDKSSIACDYILPECKHRCSGLKNEDTHFGCLFKSCKKFRGPELFNTECCYCTEDLNSGPVIQSTCGHVYHYKCLTSCLENGWSTSRITFGFLDCPGCKKGINIPKGSQCYKLLIDHLIVKRMVEEKCMKKLKSDNLESDPKIISPDSRFYNDPLSFAMASYAVYMCAECEGPFIGGKVDCERDNQLDQNKAKNEERYVCIDCSGIKTCETHGGDYLLFKCKFCCKLATWFCWGNTHFCDDCHSNQIQNRQFTKQGGYKKCPRNQDCMIQGPHPDPPCEFCLGCTQCALMRN